MLFVVYANDVWGCIAYAAFILTSSPISLSLYAFLLFDHSVYPTVTTYLIFIHLCPE